METAGQECVPHLPEIEVRDPAVSITEEDEFRPHDMSSVGSQDLGNALGHGVDGAAGGMSRIGTHDDKSVMGHRNIARHGSTMRFPIRDEPLQLGEKDCLCSFRQCGVKLKNPYILHFGSIFDLKGHFGNGLVEECPAFARSR
ncbi:MAG: hypothetical protein RLZZ165_1700 [Bacteroidota bacterium]